MQELHFQVSPGLLQGSKVPNLPDSDGSPLLAMNHAIAGSLAISLQRWHDAVGKFGAFPFDDHDENEISGRSTKPYQFKVKYEKTDSDTSFSQLDLKEISLASIKQHFADVLGVDVKQQDALLFLLSQVRSGLAFKLSEATLSVIGQLHADKYLLYGTPVDKLEPIEIIRRDGEDDRYSFIINIQVGITRTNSDNSIDDIGH